MRLLIVGHLSRQRALAVPPSAERPWARSDVRRGVSRIELAGLDDPGSSSLMEAAAGHDLDDDGVGLAHAVYRETDGNPFFVGEVLRHLSETGAIYQDAAGRWAAEAVLRADGPARQRARGDRRTGGPPRRGGRACPVDGGGHRPGLRPRPAGPERRKASEDDLLDILDAAAAVALVRELADTGRYSFAHALIQHTLYRGPRAQPASPGAPAGGRGPGGASCGDRPGARVGELARHWFSATQPIDLAKAIGYSRQAGDAALAALAPADALRYYAQALDLYPQATDPDPVLGIDLAIGLGTAQRQTGDPASATRSSTRLAEPPTSVTPTASVAAALANDRGLLQRGRRHRRRQGRDPGAGASTGSPRTRPSGARARHAVLGTHLRKPPRAPPGPRR